MLFRPIIPGCLHICSNLCKDIAKKLLHWDSFLKQLKDLEALLTEGDRRERFVNRCIGHGNPDANLFEKFSGSLYEVRPSSSVGVTDYDLHKEC